MLLMSSSIGLGGEAFGGRLLVRVLHAGEILDEQALKEYRQRNSELRAELTPQDVTTIWGGPRPRVRTRSDLLPV